MLVKINDDKIINLNNVKCIEFCIEKRNEYVIKEGKRNDIYHRESMVEIVCQILFDNSVVFSEFIGSIKCSHRNGYSWIQRRDDFSNTFTLLEKDGESKTIENESVPIYNVFPVLMERKEQIKNNFTKAVNRGYSFDIRNCKLNEEIIFEK